MAQTRPFLAALITLMLFTGCSPDAALNTYPEFGKSLVAELQARNFEAVEAKLDLALKRTTTRAKLLEMAQVLPATAPTSVRWTQRRCRSIRRRFTVGSAAAPAAMQPTQFGSA